MIGFVPKILHLCNKHVSIHSRRLESINRLRFVGQKMSIINAIEKKVRYEPALALRNV